MTFIFAFDNEINHWTFSKIFVQTRWGTENGKPLQIIEVIFDTSLRFRNIPSIANNSGTNLVRSRVEIFEDGFDLFEIMVPTIDQILLSTIKKSMYMRPSNLETLSFFVPFPSSWDSKGSMM